MKNNKKQAAEISRKEAISKIGTYCCIILI